MMHRNTKLKFNYRQFADAEIINGFRSTVGNYRHKDGYGLGIVSRFLDNWGIVVIFLYR